jgi:hypothetical protein
MPQEHYWLTVLSEELETCWPPSLKGCHILLDPSTTLQESAHKLPFRTSPIFPLRSDFIAPKLDSCSLYFYCFDTAYPVLGRLRNVGSDRLARSLWYTFGLASVLLITEDPELNKELLSQAASPPKDFETWRVRDSRIIEVLPKIGDWKPYDPATLKVCDYRKLPVAERAIVDELVSTMALIVPKVSMHIPNELNGFLRLLSQMDELVKELVYLTDPLGPPPDTLQEYTEELLRSNRLLREGIKHQDIDRLIQVNSALSYVSTQMLSGAVPILERRSLIRRHSLLGIGTAIIALTRITRSIEIAFSQFSLEDIVVDRMADAKPLPGLGNLPEYDASLWKEEFSMTHWEAKAKPREWYPKMPYFSGRLGFRETEYTISAAFQCLTSGASMEWSLLTITHELLHGYVRSLLALIFQGDPKRRGEENWEEFYRRFVDIGDKTAFAQNELESLRVVILTYCHLAWVLGSLTFEPDPAQKKTITNPGQVAREYTKRIRLLTPEELWRQYESECRNISEIFVHVLDLHYFYGSRLSAYIPLIWQSWAEVPHVSADLRQYILRSLLAIAAKEPGSEYDRFNSSITKLDELLGAHVGDTLDAPLIHEARKRLQDKPWRETLFYPFWASLILVDLADNILVSHGVRGKLFNDPLVHWTKQEMSFEEGFEYRLPDGFSEEKVLRPAAYLLDRMLRRLEQSEPPLDLEAETAILFLACCSNKDFQ